MEILAMNKTSATREAPQYPITVDWGDGSREEFPDQHALECSLEWFDTDDDPSIKVYESSGRRVRLTVVAYELRLFEFAEPYSD